MTERQTRPDGICRVRAALWISAITAVLAAPAHASLLYLNSDEVEVGAVGGALMGAKYRPSQGSFDQSLSRNGGNAPGLHIGATLGDLNSLSGIGWDFWLEHRTGQGYIFTMTNGLKVATLGWGTFDEPLAGTIAPTLNGIAPGGPYNALILEARADWAGAGMSVSQLTFSAVGFGVADGAFADMTATQQTGIVSSEILATGDLSQTDWLLTGHLVGVRDASVIGDELVRFVVTARQVDFAPVPAPGAIALLAFAGIGSRRRRDTARHTA